MVLIHLRRLVIKKNVVSLQMYMVTLFLFISNSTYNVDMMQCLQPTRTRITRRVVEERIPIAWWMWMVEAIPVGIH